MPAGRPKIQTSNFPTTWKDDVMALMKYGASRAEVYALLDISDMTFARLMREDKEFAGTIKYGERLSKAWWENVARTSLRSKDFNATLWYMNMKNRFGWVDRQQTEMSGRNGDPIETSNTVTFIPKQLPDKYWEANADNDV